MGTANPIVAYPLSSGGSGTTPGQVLIQNQTVSAVASVTFSSVPQTYKNLLVLVTGDATGADNLVVQFNADTGANYSYNLQLNSNGSSAPFYAFTSAGNVIGIASMNTNVVSTQATIFNYTGATQKNVISSASPAGAQGTYTASGWWTGTAPVTSIKFSVSTTFTGTISLYGLS